MLRFQLAVVTLLVLALRLPFLNQAIQGDDLYYLYGAEHALIDPLHPTHVQYPFQGRMVDMRGHPHPPFDSWYLALLLALCGTVREIPFHAAYIPLSLIAAWSALALARRFSPRPLSAAILFVAVPSFVINGASLETDLPFVAFWLAATALFVTAVDHRSTRLLAASAFAMLLASLTSYQAVVLVPILLIYSRHWRPAWAAALTPILAVAGWQLYERFTSGSLPATMLAGYMQSYGLQVLSQKLKSAVALTGHLAWLTFPVLPLASFLLIPRWLFAVPIAAATGAAFYDPNPLFWCSIGIGVLTLLWCAVHPRNFLCQWIVIYFGAALILFFAGSARYLLPIGAPLAILISQQISNRALLFTAAACGLTLSVLLAIVNYQHWAQYRDFVHNLHNDAATHRVWINADWGFRFYLEQEGALPLMQGQALHPGEMLVTSSIGYPLDPPAGGVQLAQFAQRQVGSSIPLRLTALGSKSAYSSTFLGLRPFDISTAPIDQISASVAVERKPELTLLPMNAPQAASQIVSGIYGLENNQWRWMSGKGIVLLKSPPRPTPLEIRFYLPPQTPARQITVLVNDREVARQTFSGPGNQILDTPPIPPSSVATVAILAGKTFTAPPDPRELSIILTSVGFTASPSAPGPPEAAPPPRPNR